MRNTAFYLHIPEQDIRVGFINHVMGAYDFTPNYNIAHEYILISLTNHSLHSALSLPSVWDAPKKSIECALRLMSDNNYICKIGEHTVVMANKGIKVGCQFVSKSQIKLIADKVLGPQEKQYTCLPTDTILKAGDLVMDLKDPDNQLVPIRPSAIGKWFNYVYNTGVCVLVRPKGGAA